MIKNPLNCWICLKAQNTRVSILCASCEEFYNMLRDKNFISGLIRKSLFFWYRNLKKEQEVYPKNWWLNK